MKIWLKQFGRGCLIVLLLGLILPAEGKVHDFAGLCEECHLGQTGSGERIFVDAVDDLCRQCHQVGKINSHPSGMLVERELPPQFKLDIEGRLTCTTCHNPCLDATVDNPYLLVHYDGPAAFCAECHPSPSFCAGAEEVAFDLTHARAWTPPLADGAVLDRVSTDCLACHDGSGAPSGETSLHESVAGGSSLDAIHSTHPVGQDYAAIAATNLNLRSIDDLSSLIALREGKVGCASCHNPYSDERDFLVFSNNASGLCRECHLL